MRRCPKCGYREGPDWPAVLWVLAFGFLYVVFIASDAPRGYRLMGFVAFLLFLAGTAWKAFRDDRSRREYLKLHPPITERMKGSFEA